MERFKNKKLLMWGGITLAAALVIGGVVAARGGASDEETVIVERRDVVEEVRVSGTVEATIVSDLGFDANGTVRDVLVGTGDTVTKGELLATLSLGTLAAELQSAKAAVAVKRAQTSNTAINIDALREKHDTLVENARIKLYSEGLIAEPKSSTYTETPPSISGRYVGPSGTYKVTIRRAAQSDRSDLYVFDMEDIEPVEISKTGATPLGTKGLYVTFAGQASAYEDTTWFVTIPNTKSASYAENYSAYQDALRERDRALEEAQAELRSASAGTSVASAELAQAEAEVARIQALIEERRLRAPFAGTITAVDIDPGESVTAGTPAISLISNDGFGVEVDLPEIDSIKVRTGNAVAVVLDAFGDTTLAATVASVNRTETVVDGVSVYEARIAFTDADDRITSGMTADVTITTDKKEGVLAVPARAITYRPDGTTYALVRQAGSTKATATDIATGLRGSDGFVEVTAGLAEGDIVVIPVAR